jgi:hypothetical protein
MSGEDLSIVRELFGADFLTAAYLLKEAIFVKDV